MTSVPEKFRRMADRLQADIDYFRKPRRNPRTAAQHQEWGDRAERVQRALRAWADAADAGALPPVLKRVTMKAQVEDLLDFEDYPDRVEVTNRLDRAAIIDVNYAEARAALLSLLDPPDTDWMDCPVCAAPFGGCDHTDEQKAAALRGEPVQTSVPQCARCGEVTDDLRLGPGGDGFCPDCWKAVNERRSLYEIEREAVQLSLLPDQPVAPPRRMTLPVSLFIEQVAGQPAPSASFVQSIRQFGQLVPIAVRETPDGYRLSDGRRRVLAMLAISQDDGIDLDEMTLLADVYSAADWSHDEVISLIANQHRSPNVVSEMEAIEALLNQDYSVEQICEATGLRKQTVERRLRMTNLEPDLRMALRLGRIAPGVAEQIAKLPRAVQAGRLVPLLATQSRITGQDVVDARRVQTQAATDALFDLSDFATPGAGDLAIAPEATAPNPLGDLMAGLLRGDLDERGRIRLERAVRSLQVNYQGREGLIRDYQGQYGAIRRAMKAAGVPLDPGWQMDTVVKRVLADRALLIDAIQAALGNGIDKDARQTLSHALAEVGVEASHDR